MEGTVSEMCNLSQGIFEEGMEKGIAEGIEKGIQEGMQQGMQKGMQQGMQKGMQQGMQKGIAEGADRERLQNIRSLMETTGWPAEQVMTAMKIPVKEQPKYLKLLSLPQ